MPRTWLDDEQRTRVEAPLVLLHLSDIHFHSGSGSPTDVDTDLRRDMEQCIRTSLDRLPGPISAILVSGDIAFSGSAEEYDTAKQWLDDLCEVARCDCENVLVVPGNHDVFWPDTDRGLVALLREKLRSCEPASIDELLAKYLPPGSEDLLRPIAPFNSFAARYGCSVSADRLWWERPFTLNDGSSLCVRGMTTTLISGRGDHRENAPLVLGAVQCQVPTSPGTLYVAMAHHPPDWLRDQDTVRDYLNHRTVAQVFGHKHRQRYNRINNSVVVSAGAVHPSRREVDWSPCFNFLSFRVDGDSAQRHLSIEVQPFTWNAGETHFMPDVTRPDSLRLPMWSPTPAAPAPGAVPREFPGVVDAAGAAASDDGSSDPYRRLVWAFHGPGLGFAAQMRILSQLNLLEDGDNALAAMRIFESAFSRAAQTNKLDDLWNAVNRALDGALGLSPFTGART